MVHTVCSRISLPCRDPDGHVLSRRLSVSCTQALDLASVSSVHSTRACALHQVPQRQSRAGKGRKRVLTPVCFESLQKNFDAFLDTGSYYHPSALLTRTLPINAYGVAPGTICYFFLGYRHRDPAKPPSHTDLYWDLSCSTATCSAQASPIDTERGRGLDA
jgi:hypothetical protein